MHIIEIIDKMKLNLWKSYGNLIAKKNYYYYYNLKEYIPNYFTYAELNLYKTFGQHKFTIKFLNYQKGLSVREIEYSYLINNVPIYMYNILPNMIIKYA